MPRKTRNIKDHGFVDFFLFWEAEYIKRYIRLNPDKEYTMHDDNNNNHGYFTVPLSNDINITDHKELSNQQFVECYYKNNNDLSPDEIIQRIFADEEYMKLLYVTTPTAVYHMKNIQPYEIYNTFKKYTNDENINCLIPFVIDFSKDINTILKEVTCEYYIATKHRDKQDSISKLIRHHIQRRGGLQRMPKDDNPDLARAIGLWLWDYLAEKKFSFKLQGKAFRAFHERFHQPDSNPIIDGYNDDSHLGRLLKGTNKCVQKKTVLRLT